MMRQTVFLETDQVNMFKLKAFGHMYRHQLYCILRFLILVVFEYPTIYL